MLLAIFTSGLALAVFGGWDPSQILYAPILIGLAGMGKAALNFSEESEFEWERGKLIAAFIFVGSGILLLGLLLLILTTWIDTEVLVYLGDIGLILSGFGVQSLSYTLFFINWFISNETVTATMVIAGIVLAIISILFLIVGFIPINIAFRAYPHLVENEEIRPG
ncbi:MAG: hypothetical protein ACTSQC_10640 [Candidatus Heimdallarchaeaceae archaeon]